MYWAKIVVARLEEQVPKLNAKLVEVCKEIHTFTGGVTKKDLNVLKEIESLRKYQPD